MDNTINLSDIKPANLDFKIFGENQQIALTYKIKDCNCKNCSKCFKEVVVFNKFEDIKIELESEYKLRKILENTKVINQN